MLKFREIDYSKDIPEIVDLIRKNLDSNFTEEFFLWKHLRNPFGKSYGLLGIHGGKIVALRMFMFWKLRNDKTKETKIAIRPVDTVVDTSLRGRGIFKEITLMGLENCSGRYDLIFNTPNENSLPGYLKMGWNQNEIQSRFFLGIINPFIRNRSFERIESSQLPTFNEDSENWTVDKNAKFLSWRYKDSRYHIISDRECYLIYSILPSGFFKKIIVCDFYGSDIKIQFLLKKVALSLKTPLVYFYKNKKSEQFHFIKKFPRKNAVIVFKDDKIGIHRNIEFSLGDLEGVI